MGRNKFVRGVSLRESDPSSQFILWAFRSCALGESRCCCLVRQFDRVFGGDAGGKAFGDVLQLVETLGRRGRRRVTLGMPSCSRLTHNETSLISSLSAMQLGDRALCEAHLAWLMGRQPDPGLTETVGRIAKAFSERGLWIRVPPAAENREHVAGITPLHAVYG